MKHRRPIAPFTIWLALRHPRRFQRPWRTKPEIDEFDIHIIPTLIREGIPLVAPRHRNVPLHLRSAKKYADGAVRLLYDLAK